MKNIFLDISEDDKEFIVSKALYRRQDNEKEVYCFVKQGEMADDFKYRPFSYPDFEESLDDTYDSCEEEERKDTIEEYKRQWDILASRIRLLRRFLQLIVSRKVYDALTKYLRQMPNEDPGSIICIIIWPEMFFFAFDCKWIDEQRRT
ncbi:MAG: hypothetical protein ACLVHS_07965 [Blautia wexlerae]